VFCRADRGDVSAYVAGGHQRLDGELLHRSGPPLGPGVRADDEPEILRPLPFIGRLDDRRTGERLDRVAGDLGGLDGLGEPSGLGRRGGLVSDVIVGVVWLCVPSPITIPIPITCDVAGLVFDERRVVLTGRNTVVVAFE
jgi:hypothetical protein